MRRRVPLIDGIEKVTGKARYTADLDHADAFVGRIFRSQALSCELRSNTFDLVLVGAGLSNSAALDTLKAAREALPATRFAIVSASDTRGDILAGLAAGFHGYISKRQSDTEILAAICDILAGRIYVPCLLAEADDGEASRDDKVGESLPSTDVDLSKLTKRQREVLQLLVQGMSNKEITRILRIAEATTKIHMAALIRALGVRNRTEAAFKAASLVSEDFANSDNVLVPPRGRLCRVLNMKIDGPLAQSKELSNFRGCFSARRPS